MMNNWEEVDRLTQVATNSAGTASAKMDIYLSSIEAKTNELKTTWEKFILSLSQSKSYKETLDFLIESLEKLPITLGKIISILILFKGNAMWAWTKKATGEVTELFTAMGKLRPSIETVRKGIVRLDNGAVRFASTEEKLAAATQVTAAKMALLKIAIAAVVAVVAFGIQKYQEYLQKQQELVDKAEEEATTHKERVATIESLMKKYKEIYSSTEDYNTKQDQLKTLSEELKTAYENEADALDLLNGQYDINVKKMEEKANLERRLAYASTTNAIDNSPAALGDGDSIFKGFVGGLWGVANGGETKYKTKTPFDENTGTNKQVVDYVNTLFSKYFKNADSQTFAANSQWLKTDGKISGIQLPKSGATNQQYLDFIRDLEEYASKNESTLTKEMLSMINGIKDEVYSTVGEDTVKLYKNKQTQQLMQLTQNEDGSLKKEVVNYQQALKEQKDLEEKYQKETNAIRKEQLEKQLSESYKSTEEALNNVTKLYDETDEKNKKYITKTMFYNYLSYSEDDLKSIIKNNPYIGLDKINKTDDYDAIKKELKETGQLGETARKKLQEIKDELYKQEDGETFVEALNSDLGDIVDLSKINLDKESLLSGYNKTQKDSDINAKKQELDDRLVAAYESNFTNGETSEGLNKLAEEIESLKEEEYKNVSKWLGEVNTSLQDLGLDVNSKWYKDLSEALKNGEINFETFYNTVSGNCEKLGIDLNDLKKAVNGVTEEFKMLGSQSQFLSEINEITDLYDKADKLKSGKNLDNDDIVELRNKYEEVNNYIAETGDLTLRNGQLLMELGDEAYEKGENALEKQIEQLENYQDAILNTVDAMGIMAEFKEELAKIDTELAETITDNAIAEAQAEGMYVDFTKEAADGVYNAKETVMMANQNLYNSEQASIQGILDKKEIQAETEQAYAEQILAVNDAIQTSDKATEEQKTEAAQRIIDAKLTEGDVVSGVADVESQAEGSSAEASAEGAESKADSQSVAAKAAITTGQAFIAMARAIAEAEGIETSGLDEAANKLSDLEGQVSKIESDNKSNAAKAAAAYAEAQNKIKEAKARLGQYRGVNTQGHGGSGSGSKNNYSAEDAAEDLKSILNDIEKYEADIEADLEDQTEELLNHYNLERNKLDLIKEELDYYNDIYDVTEDTSKWLETQLKVLDEESKKAKEIINANDKIEKQRQKVYADNAQYNVSSWFDEAGNETLAYGDLLNGFEYRMEAIQRETAAAMRAEYNLVAGSTDKDTISDAKKRIKNIEEEGANRVKALEKEKEKVENIYDSVSKLNDAWKENQENIRDALKEMNDRVKSIRDELIDDIMEQLERGVDKMNKSIEKDVTRLEQLKQVQESFNDILNTTIDTQQELDDELRANMDTYQYLDETMRQLMFNEDDYKELSKVLEGIQSDIAEIWEDHYNQIQDLTDDEMYKAEYITQETERQLAMKQKEYDIAKAELDVAKAQTNLQNVLNERNTRILGTDGQWSWVANPDAVKDARQQLADAEREKTRLEREKEQQALINVMDKMIDSDNLQIDKNNELLEKIQEAIERETEEVKSVEEALMNAEGANLPELTATLVGALGSDGGYMKELLGDINHSQKELAAALRGQTVAQAVAQLKSGTMSKSEFDELTSRLGYYFDETTGEIVTQDGRFKASYKGFTIKNNSDIQLQTAQNGVQVTGNGGQQQSSSTTDIASAEARASEEELMQIAREVWLGQWGNGADRRNRLTAAGYDYEAVQALVNRGRSYFFDQGGIASNIGLLAKDTMKPERVLSPRQTKAFENLVSNLTSNPILSALSRVPSVSSNFNELETSQDYSKKYYFSNFTVQANDIKEFIDSIETMMPMKK